MTPELEKEIREYVSCKTFKVNAYQYDVVKEMLAEIDRLRSELDRVGADLMDMIEMKNKLREELAAEAEQNGWLTEERDELLEQACEAKQNFTLIFEDLLRKLDMSEDSNAICKHPGCCCVCGHKGQCPEDGPTLT